MRFSIRLNNDLPLGVYPELAQAAEAAGFDQFWVSHDLFLHSSPVILADCARATSRIEIGTCILNPYTIHPAEIAMTAATLDDLSGGRFNLGIAAGAAEFLGWVGIEQRRPLATTRNAILAIRALFAGERVDGWAPEAFLRFKPARQIPIYVGATSPRMLRLAGEVADGVLPLLFPPEHLTTVLPHIAEGASEAGRAIDDIDVAACIWCSVSDDHEAAEAALKDKIAYYAPALSTYLRDRLGLSEAELAAVERALQVERDTEKARNLITNQMLRIGVVGTPSTLIPRLRALADLGARHLSFGPPLGPDPLEAIRTLGREVIPHFRG